MGKEKATKTEGASQMRSDRRMGEGDSIEKRIMLE